MQQLLVVSLYEGARAIELLDLLSTDSAVAEASPARHQLTHTTLQPSSSDACLLVLQTVTSTTVKFPTASLRTQFLEQFAFLKRSSVGEGMIRHPSGGSSDGSEMEVSGKNGVMIDRETVEVSSRHMHATKQIILGAGSFAVVSKSTDLLSGGPIAVKAIRKGLRFSEFSVQSYSREIRRMKSLKHKHIVKYLDCQYTVANGVLQEMFIMLEFLPGGSLASLLACLQNTVPPSYLPPT